MHDNRNVSQDGWSAASDALVAAFIRKLQPLLAYSPLLSWMLAVFEVRTASAVIGVVEIILALGILTRRLWPRISGLASLGASGMFLVTLSFLFSTPGVLDPMSPAFGFLVKDLILLGAALYTAGEALHAPK